MRFSIAVLALAASYASAALVARQLPSCANDCLFGPNVDLDGCGPRDNVCLCNSKTFVSKSTACIQKACTGNDLATAISASQQLCLSVGVTLTGEPPAETESATETSDASSTSAPQPTSTAPTTSGAASAPASASHTTSSSATGTAAPAETSKSNDARALGAQAVAVLGAAFGVAALAL